MCGFNKIEDGVDLGEIFRFSETEGLFLVYFLTIIKYSRDKLPLKLQNNFLLPFITEECFKTS